MKVALLCHFSNDLVRSRLTLDARGHGIPDFAPWVPELIGGLVKHGGIDLHVIAPYDGIRPWVQEFDSEGVHYHFFRCNLPLVNKRIPADWPSWVGGNYSINRLAVHRLVRKIKPDIVNLIGAENAYYSSCILGLRDVPVLVTIQGIYSNPERFKFQKEVKANSRLERAVHGQNKYFGINASFMPDLIGRDAHNPVYFWDRFPIAELPREKYRCAPEDKKYDFIQFSRLAGTKGVFDLLEAFALLRRKRPAATLRMVGPASERELAAIRSRMETLGLREGVFVSGAYPTHEEVLKEAVRARISVLPTHIDTIPTSIFESIYLGLPVVSCNTGDIPKLNLGDERVLLSDVGDIKALADNMLRLLDDAELRADRAGKALAFVERFFSNAANVDQHVKVLQAVLDNCGRGVQIPGELLYDQYLERRIGNGS